MDSKKKKILSIVALVAVVAILILNKYCFNDILGIGDILFEESAGDIQITDRPAPTKPVQVTKAPKATEAPLEVTEELKVTEAPAPTDPPIETVRYSFRNNKLLTQHYEKHGIDMGFSSKEDYEAAASAVINNPAALHKTEKEDGDFVYYVEETNEFVVLSTDGYIRTYFLPDAGKKYYDKQ